MALDLKIARLRKLNQRERLLVALPAGKPVHG